MLIIHHQSTEAYLSAKPCTTLAIGSRRYFLGLDSLPGYPLCRLNLAPAQDKIGNWLNVRMVPGNNLENERAYLTLRTLK